MTSITVTGGVVGAVDGCTVGEALGGRGQHSALRSAMLVEHSRSVLSTVVASASPTMHVAVLLWPLGQNSHIVVEVGVVVVVATSYSADIDKEREMERDMLASSATSVASPR